VRRIRHYPIVVHLTCALLHCLGGAPQFAHCSFLVTSLRAKCLDRGFDKQRLMARLSPTRILRPFAFSR
jgi:hypothetical protein